MALTNCPECGAQVSTLASACPQCGAPLHAHDDDATSFATAQQPGNPHQVYHTPYPAPRPARKNTGLIIAASALGVVCVGVIIAAIVLFSGGNSSTGNSGETSYSADRVGATTDGNNVSSVPAPTAASTKTTTAEAPREIERSMPVHGDDFTTPDLAFHDVHGPVKSVAIAGQSTFYFNEDGRWTNDNYTDALTNRSWTKDGSGRRTAEYYTEKKSGSSGVMYHHYDGNGNLSYIEDSNRGFDTYRTYNSAGELIGVEVRYADWKGKSPLYVNVSGYRYDSHGNWTSRLYGSQRQTRTIRYY